MSNNLDPDQDRHFVEPDLGPNCLQRLSADDTGRQVQMGALVNGLDPNEMLQWGSNSSGSVLFPKTKTISRG